MTTRLHDRMPLAGLAALTALTAACHDHDFSAQNQGPGGTNGQGTFALVLGDAGASTFSMLLSSAGLLAGLGTGTPTTVLAPSDAAMAALPMGFLDNLLMSQNQGDLIAFLQYHMLDGDQRTGTLSGLTSATTVNGADVLLDDLSGLRINQALVTRGDLSTNNGVVHGIDSVLLAPMSVTATLASRGLTTFQQVIDAAGLTGAINGGNFTVLAPSEAAFAALPAGVLSDLLLPQNQADAVSFVQYHLLPGARRATTLYGEGSTPSVEMPFLHFSARRAGAMVNGTLFDAVNIPATDGMLYTLPEVLAQPLDVFATLQGLGLTTFADALQSSGLASQLQGPQQTQGPVTVFAPTEAAFAALDPTFLATLLASPADLLAAMEYHIAESARQAHQLRALNQVTVLNGNTLAISLQGGVISLTGPTNSAALESPQHYAANGILHTIDTLLLP